MEFNNEMIKKYAKKIMGFAYNKTRNQTQAQDLSQDILFSLTTALRKHDDIADLDGFVYTVSCFTWSKFLRENKKHWNNLDVDQLTDLQSEQDIENETESTQTFERLRTEIVYLSELHRKITQYFYYDNKKGEEIAKLLNIPSSTVRWHLTEIKKKLKEGLEMEENTTYQPKHLWCGHDGNANDMNMHGIGSNPLVDNICLACYGKEMTLEELARTLHVAAFYIEPLINDLVYMDYLKVINKNKYTTNFYIATKHFRMCQAKFKLHNIEPVARNIITVFRKYIKEIKAINFVGSGLDDDFLLWSFIPIAMQTLIYQSCTHVLEKHKLTIDTPMRKDGSQHWVKAGLYDDENVIGFTEDEIDFLHKSNGNGIKTSNFNGIRSLQYDGYATIEAGINWREFGSNSDLSELQRIAAIIKNDEQPNDHDKSFMINFVEQGYVKIEQGKPKMLIPFLNEDEYKQWLEIFEKIQNEVGQNIFSDLIEKYAEMIEKELPSFLSKTEKTYYKYQLYPQYAVLYRLSDIGLLRYPTDEEAKRLSTIIWIEN